MPRNIAAPSKLAVKDRLSTKLALAFGIAFLVVFLSGWAYEGLASMVEDQSSEATSPLQPAIAEADSKIEKELAKVLAFDTIPNPAEIKDPFSDKSGISSNVKTPANAGAASNSAPQQTSAAQVNAAGRAATGSSVLTIPLQNNPGMNTTGTSVNNSASPEATNARIQARQERIRLGQDGGPESAVLAVDDLLPVGIVSGGDDATEVMFYSQSLMKTLSFPVGTRFYDGWLVDWRQEGVGFAYTGQNNAVFLKMWSRSVPQAANNIPEAKN
jgi:hypothetical protein